MSSIEQTPSPGDFRSKLPPPLRLDSPFHIYISDWDEIDSDDEPILQVQSQTPTPEKMGVVEGALLEMSHEYNLYVKDQVRKQVSLLEIEFVAEKKVQKNTRRDMDRKLDMHYQRNTAEALHVHLAALQIHHEVNSQRIEKSLQEERKEEARRAEEERKTNEARKADEAIRAAAERRAAEHAAASVASLKKVQSSGSIVRAAETALKLEVGRFQILKEIDKNSQILISSAGRGYVLYKRKIARYIRTIRGTTDKVRKKVQNLLEALNNPAYPQVITAAILAKEFISMCEAPNGDAVVFACGQVIVLVGAQVPLVMELLLAEFHRACIYTVPKHIMYSEAKFQTKKEYYKSIGYQEEDGELEKTENYLKRMQSYMKLYGAVVQTEVQGVKNLHGIEEGWRWLARFLNTLPASRFTVVALEAFLSMAGFALHRKYKSQFQKLLNTISGEFLPKLKERRELNVNNLLIYNLESRKFLQEPEGRQLHGPLLSSVCVPENKPQPEYLGDS